MTETENILKTVDCLFTWVDNDVYVFDMNTSLIGFKYGTLNKLLNNDNLVLIGTSNQKLVESNKTKVLPVDKNFVKYEVYDETLEDGYVDEVSYNAFFAFGKVIELSLYPKGFCKTNIEKDSEYSHFDSNEFTPEEWSGICKVFGLCEHTSAIRYNLSMLEFYNDENDVKIKTI